LDKGYDYDEVHDLVAAFGLTAHIRGPSEETQQLKRKAGTRARRWIVERTHSWMNRYRRLLVRREKTAETYLAFLHLACGIIGPHRCNQPTPQLASRKRSSSPRFIG